MKHFKKQKKGTNSEEGVQNTSSVLRDMCHLIKSWLKTVIAFTLITWPNRFWICYGKEMAPKGTLSEERIKQTLGSIIGVSTFLHIESTKRIMDNSYFIAPKAFGFIFMALFVRGTFNRYPLNIIKIGHIMTVAKAVAVGLIAMSCGIDS